MGLKLYLWLWRLLIGGVSTAALLFIIDTPLAVVGIALNCLCDRRFGGILQIVPEGLFDIGVHNRAETLLLYSIILTFNLQIFNLKHPSHNRKIFKFVIIYAIIDVGIFAEIIGFF